MKEIFISVALIAIFVCPTVCIVLTWDREPWWHKYPTPRRQVDDDKDTIKCYRFRRRNPKAFEWVPEVEDAPTTWASHMGGTFGTGGKTNADY